MARSGKHYAFLYVGGQRLTAPQEDRSHQHEDDGSVRAAEKNALDYFSDEGLKSWTKYMKKGDHWDT